MRLRLNFYSSYTRDQVIECVISCISCTVKQAYAVLIAFCFIVRTCFYPSFTNSRQLSFALLVSPWFVFVNIKWFIILHLIILKSTSNNKAILELYHSEFSRFIPGVVSIDYSVCVINFIYLDLFLCNVYIFKYIQCI